MKTASTSKIYLLCGFIFAFVGSLFVLISIFLARNLVNLESHSRGNVKALPVIFALVGIAEIFVACILFSFLYRKASLKRKLLRDGDYIMADITGFPVDYSVRVNRRPTYRMECSYQDPKTGTVHIFNGENFLFNPSAYISQRKIRVYVDRESDYAQYFVDTASVCPEIKRHG